MTDVSNLKFKGNVINSVTFKSNAVDTLNYNDLHWSADTEPFLNSWLVGADTGGNSGPNNLHPVTYQQKERIETAGGVVLALIAQKSLKDTIELAWNDAGTTGLGYKVEDWGFILTAKMGGWSGGSDPIAYKAFNIHSVTDPTIKKEFDRGSGYDENNGVLFSGAYTSKTFRIPASGDTISEVIDIFPYTFKYFPNTITINDICVFDPFNNNSLTPFVEASQDIIDSIEISDYNDITHILSIRFNSNGTGNYKFISLYVSGITLNFIQEYSSDYRAYFNGSNSNTDYVYNSSQEANKYVFSLSDSLIIKDGLTITTANRTKVCLPSNISSEYDITYSEANTNPLNQAQWGNKNYDVQYFSNQTEITFTKK